MYFILSLAVTHLSQSGLYQNAFSPNGKLMAIVAGDCAVDIVKTDSPQETKQVIAAPAKCAGLTQLAFSDRVLLVLTEDTIHIVDVETLSARRVPPPKPNVEYVTLSDDGTIGGILTKDHTLWLFSTADGKTIGKIAKSFGRVALNQDGSLVATLDGVFDTRTLKRRYTLPKGAWHGLNWGPNDTLWLGTHLGASSTNLVRLDPTTGKEVARQKMDGSTTTWVNLAADGSSGVRVGESGQLTKYDFEPRKLDDNKCNGTSSLDNRWCAIEYTTGLTLNAMHDGKPTLVRNFDKARYARRLEAQYLTTYTAFAQSDESGVNVACKVTLQLHLEGDAVTAKVVFDETVDGEQRAPNEFAFTAKEVRLSPWGFTVRGPMTGPPGTDTLVLNFEGSAANNTYSAYLATATYPVCMPQRNMRRQKTK